MLSKAGEAIVRDSGQRRSDTGYRRLPGIHASIDTIQRAPRPFNRTTGATGAANGNPNVTDGCGNARVHCIAVDSRGEFYVGEVAQTYRGMWRGARALQKLRRAR
ncbi:MAG: hypothetical protein AB7N65_20030 [Vicinamibacterales bacterium]